MSPCPPPTEDDIVGEGGGCGSSSSSASPPSLPCRTLGSLLTLPRREPGVITEGSEIRLFEPVDCESDLSRLVVDSPLKPDVDARGLSEDLPPGIFVRSAARKDRVDSFVSALLNEGYESREGPGPVGVCEPVDFPSLPEFHRQLMSSIRRLSRLLSSRAYRPVPKAIHHYHGMLGTSCA